MNDYEHIVQELLENLWVRSAFTFENFRNGDQFKVDELLDTEMIPGENSLKFFYVTQEPVDLANIKRTKINECRIDLENLNFLYFNHNGQRFGANDQGLISDYIYASGRLANREGVTEIYVSDQYIGDPIIKLTMDKPI